MGELIHRDEVYAIVGAAMEVHSQLGIGFAEAIYQEAMEIELADRDIPFHPQTPMWVRYKGRLLKKEYVADLICFEGIIVELKAIKELSNTEEAQVLNYLKATGYRVGLLINFGAAATLEWHRYVR